MVSHVDPAVPVRRGDDPPRTPHLCTLKARPFPVAGALLSAGAVVDTGASPGPRGSREETDPRAKSCSDPLPLAVLVALENTKGSFSSLSLILFPSLLLISFCFLYVSDEIKSRLWKEKGHSSQGAALTETPAAPSALLSKVLNISCTAAFTQRKDFTTLTPFIPNPGVRG